MRRFAEVQIGALSGGQQQRVVLARALLNAGRVLLLDEPFSGVDAPTQAMIAELFRELRAAGTTIVYATHDLARAAASASRVVLINRTVVGDGPVATMLNERRLREAFGGAVVFVGAPGSGSV